MIFGVARFTLAAVLSAAVVWLVGFLSLVAFVLWSSGWDAAMWLFGWAA